MFSPANGHCIWYSGGEQLTPADFVAYAHTPTATPPLHTPTPTLTPVNSPTPTPTSQRPPPPPIILVTPGDRVLLPQPVPPNEWVFEWLPPFSYGSYRVYISGPGGRSIASPQIGPYAANTYTYTTTVYIPNDALGPWEWRVDGSTFGGHTWSETRRFWVLSAFTGWAIYLPVLFRD